MKIIRKIGIVMTAAAIAATMLAGCKTECPPVTQDNSFAAAVLNDAQKYNDYDVKVNYTYDATLEAAMKQAIEDDKLANNDNSSIVSLMGLDAVDQMELYGIKTEDDGTIKEGTQTVVYVRDDTGYKGLTDEAWIKAVAGETNANYAYLNTELDGKQVTDTTGTYDVEWNFTYAGKAAMVKDIDEDGNVSRYIAVILTCTTSATKTLAE